MPPKCKFTKEEIVAAALEITRAKGFSAVTARGVGNYLQSSSKIIFSRFQTMEELQKAVLEEADKVYQSFLKTDMAKGQYPPYKASGMAYIRFAKEEKELFKLLFMRNRCGEQVKSDSAEVKPLVALIQKNTGLSEKKAYLLHLEMWIYVHGIGTMLATDYLEWDYQFISKMLTDGYMGIKSRFVAEEG